MKMKSIAAQDRRWFNPNKQLYWCESRIYKMQKLPQHTPTLWRIGWISHFLSSPLLHHEAHPHISKNNYSWGVGEGWLNAYLSTNPWGTIYSENKKLEYPCGLKGKLHLLKGSLVQLPLCRTWRHRIDCLFLHFHVTSTMMPRAPTVVAPPPVLRQN
jgi:hypothetical protein